MAKRSSSVLHLSDEMFAQLLNNGSRIVSDLGNHRINESLIEQAKSQSPVVTQDFSFHRLNQLIGQKVKVKAEAPFMKRQIVTLLELSRQAGGVIMALVENRTGSQKWIEDQWIEERKAHKHHANPRWVDDYYFKSDGEARRYEFLKQMQEIGEISNLVVGPRFLLQDGFSYRGRKFPPIYYTADFQYDRGGKNWIEDWKKKKGGKKGNYLANTKTIAVFLKKNPDVDFVFATETNFLP